MTRLQKILRIYSIVFIIFALVSFGYSVFADILQRINENINIDRVADTEMIPFINGAAFIIIGAALQAVAGLYGLQSSNYIETIFRPIFVGIIAISWQITGFIILFSNHILNIRLIIQIPMTFAFLAIVFLAKFKSDAGFKKKHIDLSSVTSITMNDQKMKKFDLRSLFNVNYRQKRLNMPTFTGGKRVKRINIRPKRRFK